MGLKKEIILDNGIVVNYHRIVSVNKITNCSNLIEIASYTSQEKREEEKNVIDSIQDPINVFISTEYISKEYNQTETIEDIYEYLKTLEKYQGAENA